MIGKREVFVTLLLGAAVQLAACAPVPQSPGAPVVERQPPIGATLTWAEGGANKNKPLPSETPPSSDAPVVERQAPIGAPPTRAVGGVKKKKPLPFEYGRVTINNFSQQASMPAVIFNHWTHRNRYTCRLCHVDIGFAMAAGATKLHAADNMNGIYCGACHNGKMMTEPGRKLFAACAKEYTPEEYKGCVRCHRLEPSAALGEEFAKFLLNMPREKFGNGVNWEQAEREGKIKLIDYLEGITAPQVKMKLKSDSEFTPRVKGMPNVIFSHTKHTVWSGCELCHPDIFGIRKGGTKFSMEEIFEGKYCGACHGKVSFPLTDCRRCHTGGV